MLIDDEAAKLQVAPIFQGVDIQRLRRFAMSADIVHFEPDETIMTQGEPSDYVLFILEGRAVVFGNVEIKTMIGHLGVLLDRPRTTTVTAATQVEALKLDRDTFLTLLKGCDQISLAVMRDLARIVAGITDDMTAKAAQDAAKPAQTDNAAAPALH
jgi:CRP/FNR family transcriptional regulator, cyclic AMP receptor protein